MPTTKLNHERRQYPRVETKLPLNIAADGYDFTTTTHNISCVGAYCHINKYIPPFTRLAIKMSLNKAGSVECNGVVVRTDDEKNGGFNIAIFFNSIKEAQKQKITQYLKSYLP